MSFNVGIMTYNFPCLCDFLHEMEASFFFFSFSFMSEFQSALINPKI